MGPLARPEEIRAYDIGKMRVGGHGLMAAGWKKMVGF
jgi:hypothetical protein